MVFTFYDVASSFQECELSVPFPSLAVPVEEEGEFIITDRCLETEPRIPESFSIIFNCCAPNSRCTPADLFWHTYGGLDLMDSKDSDSTAVISLTDYWGLQGTALHLPNRFHQTGFESCRFTKFLVDFFLFLQVKQWAHLMFILMKI